MHVSLPCVLASQGHQFRLQNEDDQETLGQPGNRSVFTIQSHPPGLHSLYDHVKCVSLQQLLRWENVTGTTVI